MYQYFENFIADNNLWLLSLLIVLPFIATLTFVPWLIIRLPYDYFLTKKRRPMPWLEKHPLRRILLLIIKNLAGVLVLLIGIAMLVLPGQGLLTMLIGFLLLDFPGKFRCERWLVSRKPVLGSVNWLREKNNKAPFKL